MRPQLQIKQNAFSQFVFDNADFNINNLDGFNTFHTLGGIHCVTPNIAISRNQNISRLSRLPSARVVGEYGFVPIKCFQKLKDSGLKNITIESIKNINPLSERNIAIGF